jgi:multidrug efflux pump subunit AcrA (membrane-fusion protein)
VTSAPTNWFFWLGTAVLSLLTVGALATVFYAYGRGASAAARVRRVAPFAIAAVMFFAFGTFALAYFSPPTARRKTPQINVAADEPAAQTNLSSATATRLTVTKESQLLFGIKTETVATRQITSGLKTTGVVRAKPDARAVVTPPVAGRIVLRQGLGLGSAVGRGEQIGTIEQVLDVSGQTELEAQRLEVEARRQETEARRLEIKNNVLALQREQNAQRDVEQQARARLAQAQRELQRSENLVEAGAVPRRRVEEARTAARVAELEVAAAERQIKNIGEQIAQANAGQTVFRAPNVRQPSRVFPLTAPVAGIINEIRATSGQQIESGTEILSIVNLSTVLLEAQVFERDLPVVRESTRASFTAAPLGNEVYQIGAGDGDGRLVSIGQTVNPETRTVPVIYEVTNPLQRLRDGNFVEITIDTSGNQQVLAVPKRAVVNEQGQTFVFVFEGGETFERRLVALGAEGADFFEVKNGLTEGERIVTEGVYQLRSVQPGA